MQVGLESYRATTASREPLRCNFDITGVRQFSLRGGDLYFLTTDSTICLVRGGSSDIELFCGTHVALEEEMKVEPVDGHRLTQCVLSAPRGIEAYNDHMDSDDRIWIAEMGTNSIRQICYDYVGTYAGSEIGLAGHKDGPISQALFNRPCSIAFLDRYLVITEEGSPHLRVIHMNTETVSTVVVPAFGGQPQTPHLYPTSPSTYDPREYEYAAKSKPRLIMAACKNIPEAFSIDIHSGQSSKLPNHYRPISSFNGTPMLSYQLAAGATALYATPDFMEGLYNPILSAPRTKELCRLPEGASLPFYSPPTNTLFYFDTTTRGVYAIPHFLHPAPRPFRSFPDYSSLLSSPIAADVNLRNIASQKEWFLHSFVLQLHKPFERSLERLKSFIQHTTLPTDTIDTMVDQLYFKDIDTELSCMQLCRVIWAYHKIGLKAKRMTFELWRLVDRMTPEQASFALMEVWNDSLCEWRFEDTPIFILSAKTRPFLSAQLASQGLPTNLLEPLQNFFLTEGTHDAIQAPTHYSSLHEGAGAYAAVLRNDPKPLLVKQSTYAIGFEGEERQKWICVDGAALWPQWSWFRKIIENGEVAAQTRIIHLRPGCMSLKVLKAIISAMHARLSPRLNAEDQLELLKIAREFELVDENFFPYRAFTELIYEAIRTHFPPLTEENYLDVLKKYKDLDMDEKVDESINTVYDLGLNINLDSAVEKLDSDLVNRLTVRKKKAKLADGDENGGDQNGSQHEHVVVVT